MTAAGCRTRSARRFPTKNLMDAVTGSGGAADAGIKVFSPESRTLRSSCTAAPHRRWCSRWEYENLTSQTFTKSASDYANVALVGGEGEGVERVFAVYGESEGTERREAYSWTPKACALEDFRGRVHRRPALSGAEQAERACNGAVL